MLKRQERSWVVIAMLAIVAIVAITAIVFGRGFKGQVDDHGAPVETSAPK